MEVNATGASAGCNKANERTKKKGCLLEIPTLCVCIEMIERYVDELKRGRHSK